MHLESFCMGLTDIVWVKNYPEFEANYIYTKTERKLFLKFQRHADYHNFVYLKIKSVVPEINRYSRYLHFVLWIYLFLNWGGRGDIVFILQWNFSTSLTNSSAETCLWTIMLIFFFCLLQIRKAVKPSRSLLHIEQSLHRSTGTNSVCPWQLWPTEKPHVPVTKVYCVNPARSFYSISGRMFEGMKNVNQRQQSDDEYDSLLGYKYCIW